MGVRPAPSVGLISVGCKSEDSVGELFQSQVVLMKKEFRKFVVFVAGILKHLLFIVWCRSMGFVFRQSLYNFALMVRLFGSWGVRKFWGGRAGICSLTIFRNILSLASFLRSFRLGRPSS